MLQTIKKKSITKKQSRPGQQRLVQEEIPLSHKSSEVKEISNSKGRPTIYSRHPSHSPLRTKLAPLPFFSLIRFGSTTESKSNSVELNTVQAIKNSSSKLLMKEKFRQFSVKTADWTTDPNQVSSITEEWKYKLVAKSHFGSRGRGNTLISSQREFDLWKTGKTVSNYIFEKFYNYTREYRLHINSDGCFYTCRKMLKSDAPEDSTWFRNDSNCVWFVEENEKFDKPVNWNNIVRECLKALNATGLDFGAVDLRIQSAKDKDGKVRKDPDFIIVEINSAPSFGNLTLEKYLEVLPIMLKKKFLTI